MLCCLCIFSENIPSSLQAKHFKLNARLSETNAEHFVEMKDLKLKSTFLFHWKFCIIEILIKMSFTRRLTYTLHSSSSQIYNISSGTLYYLSWGNNLDRLSCTFKLFISRVFFQMCFTINQGQNCL